MWNPKFVDKSALILRTDTTRHEVLAHFGLSEGDSMFNKKTVAVLAASASLLSGLAVVTPALGDTFSDSLQKNKAYVEALSDSSKTEKDRNDLKAAAKAYQLRNEVTKVVDEKAKALQNKLTEINHNHSDGAITDKESAELSDLKKAKDNAQNIKDLIEDGIKNNASPEVMKVAKQAYNEGLTFTAKQILKAKTLDGAKALLKAAEDSKAAQEKKEKPSKGGSSSGSTSFDASDSASTPAVPAAPVAPASPAAPSTNAAPAAAPNNDVAATTSRVHKKAKVKASKLPQTGEADVAGLLASLSSLLFGGAGVLSLKKRS